MAASGVRCLICNCEKSMPLDAGSLKKALGAEVGTIHTNLCRTELSSYESALENGEPLLVACTQEAPLFSEIAEENGSGAALGFVNIREMAGWSDDAAKAAPKIAALIQQAQMPRQPARLKTISSDGLCLVYGAGQAALDAAKLLSERLSVTLLLTERRRHRSALCVEHRNLSRQD